MPKLLADFLQEQQEPFALESYLLERGYLKHVDARCRMHDSVEHAPPNCSHFLRGVFMLVSNADKKVEANRGREKINAAGDGVSTSSSSATLFNSCSESDAGASHCSETATRRFVKCGNCFLEGEVGADTNLKVGAEEDSKQLSPVSVLLDEDSPLDFSKFIFGEVFDSMRKQQLMDCRRELIEKCSKKEKKMEERMLGGEDDWENVRKWRQDSMSEINILHFSSSDFMDSMYEWHVDFEQQRLEISMDIEHDILENFINEMVVALWHEKMPGRSWKLME